jgi:hypothetical protein
MRNANRVAARECSAFRSSSPAPGDQESRTPSPLIPIRDSARGRFTGQAKGTSSTLGIRRLLDRACSAVANPQDAAAPVPLIPIEDAQRPISDKVRPNRAAPVARRSLLDRRQSQQPPRLRPVLRPPPSPSQRQNQPEAEWAWRTFFVRRFESSLL